MELDAAGVAREGGHAVAARQGGAASGLAHRLSLAESAAAAAGLRAQLCAHEAQRAGALLAGERARCEGAEAAAAAAERAHADAHRRCSQLEHSLSDAAQAAQRAAQLAPSLAAAEARVAATESALTAARSDLETALGVADAQRRGQEAAEALRCAEVAALTAQMGAMNQRLADVQAAERAALDATTARDCALAEAASVLREAEASGAKWRCRCEQLTMQLEACEDASRGAAASHADEMQHLRSACAAQSRRAAAAEEALFAARKTERERVASDSADSAHRGATLADALRALKAEAALRGAAEQAAAGAAEDAERQRQALAQAERRCGEADARARDARRSARAAHRDNRELAALHDGWVASCGGAAPAHGMFGSPIRAQAHRAGPLSVAALRADIQAELADFRANAHAAASLAQQVLPRRRRRAASSEESDSSESQEEL